MSQERFTSSHPKDALLPLLGERVSFGGRQSASPGACAHACRACSNGLDICGKYSFPRRTCSGPDGGWHIQEAVCSHRTGCSSPLCNGNICLSLPQRSSSHAQSLTLALLYLTNLPARNIPSSTVAIETTSDAAM